MLYQIVSNVCEAFELFIEDDITVGELRVLVGAMLGVEDDERRLTLTFQGQQLHDNSLTWDVLLRTRPLPPGAPRKLFVHVSDRYQTGSTEAMRLALLAAGTTKEEERAGREQARMVEPIVDLMVQNPEFVESVLEADPAMKRILKEHPEMDRMLRDPETLKGLIMSQMDPEQRRLMSRDIQLQMAQVSAIPGGEQVIERYFTSILHELDAEGDSAPRDASAEVGEAQARPDPCKEANSEALPNPWKQQSSSSSSLMQNNPGWMGPSANMGNFLLSNFGGRTATQAGTAGFPSLLPLFGNAPLFGGSNPFSTTESVMSQGGGAPMNDALEQPGTSASLGEKTTDNTTNDKRQWATQLATLKEMGFEDEVLCVEALYATNGDVDAAVNFIADKTKQ